MTILGVSTLSETVLDAQRFGGQHFFEMEELSIQTGKYLADLLEVEDVQIVSSASAGIAQSVAAVIGKGELYPLYHPYAESIKKRQIILPKGHNVDYGTAVEIMVQQGGGQVVEAGYANMCTPEQIEMMITEETAGILYIKSHHTVQKFLYRVMAFYIENPCCFFCDHHFDLFRRTHISVTCFDYLTASLLYHDFHSRAVIYIVSFWQNDLSFFDGFCIRMIKGIQFSFTYNSSYRLSDSCRCG